MCDYTSALRPHHLGVGQSQVRREAADPGLWACTSSAGGTLHTILVWTLALPSCDKRKLVKR